MPKIFGFSRSSHSASLSTYTYKIPVSSTSLYSIFPSPSLSKNLSLSLSLSTLFLSLAMARKREAPKPNSKEAESQEPLRSTKKSKNKAINEEEDFVLQISDAEENEEEEIVSNEEQEAVEMNISRVAKRLETEEQSVFIGKPVDVAEAKRRWPERYLTEVYFFDFNYFLRSYLNIVKKMFRPID